MSVRAGQVGCHCRDLKPLAFLKAERLYPKVNLISKYDQRASHLPDICASAPYNIEINTKVQLIRKYKNEKNKYLHMSSYLERYIAIKRKQPDLNGYMLLFFPNEQKRRK